MAEYSFEVRAQLWSSGAWGSSYPVHDVTVVSTDKESAKAEVITILGAAEQGTYWRMDFHTIKDVRLVTKELETVET